VERSLLQLGQESIQLGEVLPKLVDAAERRADRAERCGRVGVELGEPMLEALELCAQDARQALPLLGELPQLGLGDEALRLLQHHTNSLLQSDVELEPGIAHQGSETNASAASEMPPSSIGTAKAEGID